MSRRETEANPSEYAGLPLKPADIFYDLIDVLRSHSFDLWHIAEVPVMRTDAVGCRHLKCRIAMMIGLINFVNQGRAVIGSYRLRTMTGQAIGVEFGLTHLKFDWNVLSAGRAGGRSIARRP